MAFSVAENSCRTSAFHPEADIRLNFPKRSANDPKRTPATDHGFSIQLLYLGN
jgi:hypothetical protein